MGDPARRRTDLPGYWQRGRLRLRRSSPDGWFHSGDIGELDDEGLRITGRRRNSSLPQAAERGTGRAGGPAPGPLAESANAWSSGTTSPSSRPWLRSIGSVETWSQQQGLARPLSLGRPPRTQPSWPRSTPPSASQQGGVAPPGDQSSGSLDVDWTEDGGQLPFDEVEAGSRDVGVLRSGGQALLTGRGATRTGRAQLETVERSGSWTAGRTAGRSPITLRVGTGTGAHGGDIGGAHGEFACAYGVGRAVVTTGSGGPRVIRGLPGRFRFKGDQGAVAVEAAIVHPHPGGTAGGHRYRAAAAGRVGLSAAVRSRPGCLGRTPC